MSRTYKKYSGNCYRSPHGHRQALVAGARHRAIPPDSWDDISFDRQVYLPQKVADGMARHRGVGYYDIINHLMKKFKIRLGDAEWMAEHAIRHERRRVPEGLMAVYLEKEIV